MRSRITKDFRTLFDRMPIHIQEQAARAYRLWQSDPYHPSLEFKRVSQRQPIYSVRIGSGYRVLGLREPEDIYWFWIGSHSEYDAFLKRLLFTEPIPMYRMSNALPKVEARRPTRHAADGLSRVVSDASVCHARH